MFVTESPLRDLLRLIVWYPMRWFVALLPPRAALRLFAALGDLHRLAAPGGRSRLAANLRRLLPRADRAMVRAVTREYYRNHYISQLLVMVYPRLSRAGLDRLTTVEGAEHLEAALAAGRGAVLVHGHFGPEQLALAGWSLLGHDCVQVGHLTDEGLSAVGRAVAYRQRRRCEARIPGEIVEATGAVWPLLRRLRAGTVVLTSGDGSGRQERIGRHIPLPFFGHSVSFPTGPARMARAAGVPLLPVFVVRGQETPYAIVIEPPIAASDVTAATREFVERYAARVADDPGLMRFLDVFRPGGLMEP
jgi:KDO2-lipid IV(A) lauroyltransferase